jgi:hypothetical protein
MRERHTCGAVTEGVGYLRASRQLVMTLRLRDAVLADLVQQGLVADFQQSRSLFPIPVGFVERLGDGFGFGPVFGGAGQDFRPPPEPSLFFPAVSN